jgi:hypothetical protein
MLSKKSQTQKDKCHMFPLICSIKKKTEEKHEGKDTGDWQEGGNQCILGEVNMTKVHYIHE